MWHRGAFSSTAAGQGLAKVWDALVTLNAKWSVYDAAAGTNCKVYRCYDAAANCDFYVRVDDNYTGYWIIQLWQGWDAVGHAGTGASITVSSSTYTFVGRRPLGGFCLSVKDHRIIYIEMTSGTTQYIGQPRRYDPSLNTPLILSYSSGAIYTSALEYIANSTQSACRFLFDEAGNQALVRGDGGQTASDYRVLKDGRGRWHLPSEKVIAGQTTGLAVGTLEGVVSLGGANNGQGQNPARGTILHIDGEDWMVVAGVYSTYYGSAVRMA